MKILPFKIVMKTIVIEILHITINAKVLEKSTCEREKPWHTCQEDQPNNRKRAALSLATPSPTPSHIDAQPTLEIKVRCCERSRAPNESKKWFKKCVLFSICAMIQKMKRTCQLTQLCIGTGSSLLCLPATLEQAVSSSTTNMLFIFAVCPQKLLLNLWSVWKITAPLQRTRFRRIKRTAALLFLQRPASARPRMCRFKRHINGCDLFCWVLFKYLSKRTRGFT